MWHHRVPHGALARLERHAGKLARAVLRGLSGSNPARLPGIGETCLRVTRPDPTHLARLASPYGVVADGGVVLDRRNPPGSIVNAGPDAAASARRAKPAPPGGVLPARRGLYLSSSPTSITAQRVGQILPSSHP